MRGDITYRTSLILSSLKDVKIDNNIAPDGMSIEDRLRSLVKRTADDIRHCSNVCDTYGKKRLLAKVLLGSIWDAKLLEFVRLFNHRRLEFEFELSLHHTSQVDRLVRPFPNLTLLGMEWMFSTRSPLFRDPLLLKC